MAAAVQIQGLPWHYMCVLCGTCTCPPQDDTLIQYQGVPEQRDFIHEDDVAWLGRYRMVVACASEHQLYPSATTREACVTGPVRHRGRKPQDQRREFAKGNTVDIDFGPGVKSIRGEGVDEVISVPAHNIAMYEAGQSRALLFIHESCLVILNRAQVFQGQVDSKINIDQVVVDFLPNTIDQLLVAYKTLESSRCSSDYAWGADSDDDGQQRYAMPKVYFLNPLADNHISRLRPFLQIHQRSSTNRDKYNSHLDQWQRALLLEKKSYKGDPLSRWPTEILMQITSFLTARETGMLCYASNAAAWKLNQAGLWFRRLKTDMPWLWDVTMERVLKEQFSAFGVQTAADIDWQAIYFDLKEQSIYESRKRTLSLVNRKRIWQFCQNLLGREE